MTDVAQKSPDQIAKDVCHSAPPALTFESVSFAHTTVLAARDGDRILVPLNRMCDALGVDLRSQLRKLRGCSWASVVMMTMQVGGQRREIACLDHRAVPTWLVGIKEGRVAEEVRPVLIELQQRFADVLADYFFGASNRILPPEEVALIQLQTAVDAKRLATATASRVDAVEASLGTVQERVALLESGAPEHVQAFALRGYARLVGYKLPPGDESTVLSVASKALKKRADAEGVKLPAPAESGLHGTILRYPRGFLDLHAAHALDRAVAQRGQKATRPARTPRSPKAKGTVKPGTKVTLTNPRQLAFNIAVTVDGMRHDH